MRTTRIPNFIPIERWEMGEKSGEPKSGERKIFLLVQSCLKNASFFKKKIEILRNRENCPRALIRKTSMLNIIPIGRWERGEKPGEPKTGDNKILVLDAK